MTPARRGLGDKHEGRDGGRMNDTYREFKVRLRKLDALLGGGGLSNVELAQAVSRVHRAERRADRSREPTGELQTLLERAELLAGKSA